MSLKIIVADSEPKSAPLLTAVATPLGHSVLQAEDYQAAAQKGESQHFDVVFLGMRPPELTGIGVVHRLRNSGPNRDAAIVMVTATDDIPLQRKAFGEGADFVLTEPVQGGRLHRMLSAMAEPGWKERKPLARLTLLAEVDCSWLHRKYALHSLNISESGMLLHSTMDVPVGEEVVLEFKIAEAHASVEIRARIVRKDAASKLVAVEFVDVSREARSAIQVYVLGQVKNAGSRRDPMEIGLPRVHNS
jgi:CheY-like chemotaxis protein